MKVLTVNDMLCDIIAGEQGPSRSPLDQVLYMRVIYIFGSSSQLSRILPRVDIKLPTCARNEKKNNNKHSLRVSLYQKRKSNVSVKW